MRSMFCYILIPEGDRQTSDKYSGIPSGPDSSSGRASLGGPRFETRPRHTKGVKNDTGYPHDCRADKGSYPHDRRADKDSYPHEGRADKDFIRTTGITNTLCSVYNYGYRLAPMN